MLDRGLQLSAPGSSAHDALCHKLKLNANRMPLLPPGFRLLTSNQACYNHAPMTDLTISPAPTLNRAALETAIIDIIRTHHER